MIQYDVFNAAGQLLWRSREVDAADEKALVEIEQAITVPEGGMVCTWVDGRIWPENVRTKMDRPDQPGLEDRA